MNVGGVRIKLIIKVHLTFQLSTQLSTLGVKLSGKLESLVEGSGELKHLSPTAAGQLVQIRIFLC